jgi:phosphoesterase RecJ-like protein
MASPTPVFTQILGLIHKAERILVVADGSPDGDSIGSTSAFLNWLLREGKNVTAFCKEKLPRALLYLDGSHRFTNDPHVFDQAYDLILTFDAGDLRHCGIDTLLPHVPKTYTLVVFDHHNTNERFGDVNAVFTDACSTCEVVYRFFVELGIEIDDRMATSLLTGINTDTGSFQNSGTTVKGMDAAGHLVACGARHPDILRNLIKNKSVDGLKLWGLGLERLVHVPELDLAVTYFCKEDLTKPGSDEAIDGVSNFLQSSCAGADAILVLKEKPDGTIRGSMRSLNRDISILCKKMGGGGHKKAAGFSVSGPLELKNGRPALIETISNHGI